MKVLALTFITLGALLLLAALFPTREICSRKHYATKAWRVLGVLVIIFLVCYGIYGAVLLKSPADRTKLLVSIIMFGGGIFVYSVVKLAQLSIKQITNLAEEQKHRSLHDDLTGLPNQNFLHDKIDQVIDRAKTNKETFAIILVDLNHFKEINTSLGHFYGDFLLQQAAERLGESIRNSDTLARFSGNKFAVFLPGTTQKHAIAVSSKIIAAMKQPFKVERNAISLALNIGIVTYPEHGEQPELLFQRADIAMYEARKNHVEYQIFDPGQERNPLSKLVMANEMRDAFQKGELTLFFQPQISTINGKLSGAEALVRWFHPEKELVMPDDFISIIEQSGLSNALINWVLDNALQQQNEWQQLGLDINMSVNLSVKNLHDYEFPTETEKLLKKWRTNPGRLTLEVTESDLMVDPGRVTKVVSALKEIGVNLSIDDFGTGYSSLSYLRKFPAREIKIDKSFIFDMVKNEENALIVKSTIDLAHNIGRLVVAEGVENHDTQVLLKRLGCDYIQGFFISKALPADEFLKWHARYDYNLNQAKV